MHDLPRRYRALEVGIIDACQDDRGRPTQPDHDYVARKPPAEPMPAQICLPNGLRGGEHGEAHGNTQQDPNNFHAIG